MGHNQVLSVVKWCTSGMKIAIVLAICVLFSSGTYAAFAEEPIPTLNFEGGDYTVYKGNQILKTVTVEIENHDHKVHPKIHTIFENQIIDTIDMGHSSSGFYQTFLNIDKNYQSGDYNLQLEYDNKKLKPIPFKIIKEFEEQKERILGFGDYRSKVYDEKESSIDVLKNNIDIEFSTFAKQTISGIYDSRGMAGKIQLEINGPKSMINNVRFIETGFFTTDLLIDREWPTGTYKVTGMFNGKSFASNEFTIKNFNKDSLLKNTPIEGILNLETVKSNQYNVIIVKGQLSGSTIPEQIALKIFHEENMIDILYIDLKNSSDFDTSLVLYDHSKKSSWNEGKYTIEIVDSGTLESHGIASNFEITKSGNTVTDFDHGILLTSDKSKPELLNFVEEIEIKKHYPKEIQVYGIIENYRSATPINISIVNEQGNIDEFSVFGKKSGQYDAPVVIDSEWLPGKYDIYVNYRDETINSISFNIENNAKSISQIEDVEENAIVKKEHEIEKFNILQNDSSTNQFVKLEFSTKAHEIGYNRIDVSLEKPNGEISMYKPRTAMDGSFDISLIVENSWDEGEYFLSFIEDNEKITFGQFSITKEKIETESFILSEILETANPESVYQQKNEMKISKERFVSSNDGIYLDIFGTINEYSSGKISLNVFEKNTLFSVHEISPKSDGTFFSTILIDNKISKGFHEINTTYNNQVVGKSEIFITEPIIFYAEFATKPIKISHDMFIESNNNVGVNIAGLVEEFSNTNHNSVELVILHPNGKMEHVQLDTAKWGYYSYTLPVTDKWDNGTYVISVNFDGKKLGHVYMQIIDFDINWLKINTQKWIDGDISSYQYENRINHVIQYGLIQTDQIEQDSLPDWMKMNAKKWIEGDISEKEYFNIVKFIVS